MTSKCIAHVPCPACGSRDNRAVYDDGHEWCFGCGDYTNATHRPPIRVNPEEIEEDSERLRKLLQSAQAVLPSPNKLWLSQYGLNALEMALFKYIPYMDRHVYVVYGENGPVFADCRSVSGKTPKNLSFGEKPFHLIGNEGPIVLVEDVVSAIKVGRHARAMPLFGAHCNMGRLLQLTKLPNPDILVWLDKDKMKEAMELRDRITLLGLTSRSIITEKDPKEYSNQEILGFTRGLTKVEK